MERNELCYEIEKLPASEQQTKVSLLACEMVNKMEAMEKNLWATREELYDKKQRLDTLRKRLEAGADGTDRIDILEMHIKNLEFEISQAKKEVNEYRQLYLTQIRDNAIDESVRKLCNIIVNSTPDTTIKGDIEDLALHIAHWFTVSKSGGKKYPRNKLARYEEALQKINAGDIDPIKTAGEALMSLPTCKKVEDDPDDYYTEPPDGSHGMQGVPGR